MAQIILGKVVGDTGPQGIQGVDGPQGLPGEQGVPGVDGSNATVTIANDLIQTVPGKVLDATQGKVINDALTTHKAEKVHLYEEGAWTPDLQFTGAKVGVTYGFTGGFYTRIGRIVNFSGNIVLTNKGSSVGVAVIAGLPFVASEYTTVNIRAESLNSALTGFLQTTVTGGSFVALEVFSAGVSRTLTNADLTNTTVIYLNGKYIV